MNRRLPSHPIIDQVREHFAENDYAAAERLLLDGLAESPLDADLCAAYLLILLWTQREEEGLDYVLRAQASEHFKEAAQFCADTFFCRAEMAAYLGIHDRVSGNACALLRDMGFEKSANVGIGISAALIVRNEEKFLPRCLKSICDLVEEIIIVDTGSTDRTLEIAQEFGAKIGHFEWCDDFAAARNVALEMATQPWVLWIDADEELASGGAHMLREACMRPQFGGYAIPIENVIKDHEVYTHCPVRLFRNDPEIRFTGRIHEQIIQGILQKNWRTATLQGVRLIHHGYSAELISDRNKIDRTLKILEHELRQQPEFSFHWFNLANTHLVAKNYSEAAQAAAKAIQLLEPQAGYAEPCFSVLGSAQMGLEQFQDCLKTVEQAHAAGHHSIVLQYLKAEAHRNLGQFELAKQASEICLNMRWHPEMTGDSSIATLKRYLQAARIAGSLEDYGACISHCDHVLKSHPDLATALGLKALALSRLDRPTEALRTLERCYSDPVERGSALLLGAQLEGGLGMHDSAVTRLAQRWKLGFEDEEGARCWRTFAFRLGNEQALRVAEQSTLSKFAISSNEMIDRGHHLHALGDATGSLLAFTEAARLEPDNANAWFCLGDALYGLSHYAQAAESYQNGLRLQPDLIEGWFVLGNALSQMDQEEAAITCYKQCLQLCPDHQAAKHNLGLIEVSAA